MIHRIIVGHYQNLTYKKTYIILCMYAKNILTRQHVLQLILTQMHLIDFTKM